MRQMSDSQMIRSKRLDVLQEVATLIAKSEHAKVSTTYAMAGEVWALWWAEKDRLTSEAPSDTR